MPYPKPPMPSMNDNETTFTSTKTSAKADVKVELVQEGSCGWNYLRYTCRNCGKVICSGTKHCSNCGIELDWKKVIVKEVDFGMTILFSLVISFFACALTFLSCK